MDIMNSCRCCLHDGPDMDLTTRYTYLGKTEIYLDMLKECFDLHMTLNDDGPCGICLACVGRLRDASAFKMQVQRSQVELQAWLQGVSHVLEDRVEIKIEAVESDGSEGEMMSHESVPVKTERLYEDEPCNEESSASAPLDVAAGAESIPASTMSHDDTRTLTDHMCDESDRSSEDKYTDEDYSRDTSEDKTPTGQQRYPCNLCDKDFINKSALTRHQRVIHQTEKLYTCEECNKKFTKQDFLDRHKTAHTGDKSFGCDVCEQQFDTKNRLNSHKVIHTGEKPFKCEKCKKNFARQSYLQQHESICKEKSYVCDVCNKQFGKRMVLKRHALIHTGIKPYSCAECDKRFSKKDDLNVHKRMHTGEKTYSCDECDKQFYSKKNLLRHKTVHTGQKFVCTVCHKQFSQNYSLKKHQKFHTGELVKMLQYTCKDCDKQFTSKTDLDRHGRIHTGEKPFACEACQKQFKQKSHLSTHTKTCMKHLTS